MNARDQALRAVKRASFAEPSTAWAERILARHERGEKLPSISLDWARKILQQNNKDPWNE
jgi:hypothetical protein